MTNKGNSTAPLISLPRGGGALAGLGEKFAPDLHTGTGNLSVPITLPAGRNGFQPQLTLSYSTGQGQGAYGLGWALGIPGVSRKTSSGNPRYRDAAAFGDQADTFILSGAEDLVPVAGAEGAVQYRPRTEGLFAEITRFRDRDSRADYWRVRTKDGLTSYYGTNPDDVPSYPDDVPAADGDPAITFKPGAPSRIFGWYLTLTVDAFGNRIEYLYERSRSTAEDESRGHRWDVPLLKRIRYADYGEPSAPEFLIAVDFVYEPRPDPCSDYRAGFELRQALRCTTIHLQTHAEQVRDVKEYRFRYLDEEKTRASLLQAIEVHGFDHDGSVSQSLPPIEFSYSQFAPELSAQRDFFSLAGHLPAVSLADPTLELVDLHGQGLPDILELGAGARYFRNLGNGTFDVPRPMRDAPGGLALGTKGVRLLDADGDGRMDLVVMQGSLSGYFPLRFGPDWDRRSFRRYTRAPSFDFDDPEVRLFDLTGDGVTDALRTGSRFECFFNDPNVGWAEARRVERKQLASFPDIKFSDPRVLLADMTGDGMTDIVLVYDGSVCYWPNLGYGDFGARVQMLNAPRLPWGYDPKRLLIGDVNGDGVADLMYVDDRRVHLWINQSGNAFSDPIVIQGTPAVMHCDAIRLTDLLGTGVAGILWTSDVLLSGSDHYFFLDLTRSTKPYLLSRVQNNLGAETRVEYAASTRFYLDDRDRRGSPWRTTLPFPVQTVARVEVADALSGGTVVTEYEYHHGYWDGFEREFRGFARVDHRDAEDVPASGTERSPALLTKSWFDQGAVEDEQYGFAALDCSDEYWSEDPAQLGHAEAVDAALNALERTLAGQTSAQKRRVRRDALRSLRGSLLRTELYALDGSARQGRPYTVTEGAFSFREEAAPPAERASSLRLFFPNVKAQRTTQWERGADPLAQLAFMHRYDAFGQLESQTQLACPRGWRGPLDRPAADYLATRTVTSYAVPDDTTLYLVDREARSDTFEITTTAGKTVPEVAALADSDLSLVRFAQSLSRYDGDAFHGLGVGRVGGHGALSRRETLVLTAQRMVQIYGVQTPVYLQPGTVAWPAEYPADFQNALPVRAGYQWHSGNDADWSGAAAGFFAASDQFEYDFQRDAAGVGRGLVLRRRNALDHDLTLTYTVELLVESTKDAAGLIAWVEHDLRFFQPSLLTDSNGNEQHFEFRPDGLLSSIRKNGKTPQEGDHTRPSVRYEYDLFAFQARGQPISVATVRYVHHDGETGLSAEQLAEAIETREYSDGFGRVLQTRAQGEDVRFGDAAFGRDVVPADQTVSALAPVTGSVANVLAGPHVTVSGWQIYNNKGRIVRKYEPFFSEGWDFAAPGDAQKGQCVRTVYDPRGQVIRTIRPDASEELVLYGVPGTRAAPDLTDPTRFEPTPWEAYTYDANDSAGRTHTATASSYRHCWNTPASIEIDALGRTRRSVERNRTALAGNALGAIEEYTTRFAYDIDGNVIEVRDALNRVAFTHGYDFDKHALYTNNLDAGEHWVVLDAGSAELERRDTKGALTLQAYDSLARPLRLWARDATAADVTLRRLIVYGDALPASQNARDQNLLGKAYVQCDGAGKVTFHAYDFKGNPLEKTREVIADAEIAAQVDAGARTYTVDWDAGPALEGTFTTSASYDALNRITRTTFPEDVDGDHKEFVATYNRAGALEAISLDGDVYVSRIAYNAHGQRVLVAYGNGYLTRYAYDLQTQRLTRLRSETFRASTAAGPPSYEPLEGVLQDFGYCYDLAGNIRQIRDRSPDCGVRNVTPSTDDLDRSFEYDALYRLTSATGRESKAQSAWPVATNSGGRAKWDRSSAAQGTAFGPPGRATTPDAAPDQTGTYEEAYSYDPAGNLIELWHKSGSRPPWMRVFGMGGVKPSEWAQAFPQHATGDAVWAGAPSNRLTHTSDDDPNAQQTHRFDACGNLIQENGNRFFAWNHADQMGGFSVRANAAAPASIEACYLYDASGQRVKKWLRKGASVETSVAIEQLFEQHVLDGARNNTLRVADGRNRIAMRRVGRAFSDDGAPDIDVKYQLGDHLGSVHVMIGVDAGANVQMNREEFCPYGETSYGGFARKRYRFTGMERDEESGLSYHGARYYSPWSGRWNSCDQAGAGHNGVGTAVNRGDSDAGLAERTDTTPGRRCVSLYEYCFCSPVRFLDPTGFIPIEEIMDVPVVVKSRFGLRPNPFGGGGTEAHGALDLSAPYATEIRAWAGGTVVVATFDKGAGNFVMLDHGHGVRSLYMHGEVATFSDAGKQTHPSSAPFVEVGQNVSAGDVIGLTGSSGRSTGPHLHLELRIFDPRLIQGFLRRDPEVIGDLEQRLSEGDERLKVTDADIKEERASILRELKETLPKTSGLPPELRNAIDNLGPSASGDDREHVDRQNQWYGTMRTSAATMCDR
jgi:RHS repeat-associated protein